MARHIGFLDLLEKEVLLADGAKSTIWMEQGLSTTACVEQNLSNPANVTKLHLDYIQAGARIIETNTFRANQLQLAKLGLADQLRAINLAAVAAARQAIKISGRDDIFIAGAIGPLGALVKPYGNLTLTELGAIYQQQITVLYEAGVDILIIETHPSLLETLEAVRAARSLDTRPIVAQMTFLEDGLSKFGDELRRSLEALAAADADVVGVNCGLGPHHMYEQLQGFLRTTPLRVSVQPNAGLPQMVSGRQVYLTLPEYLQDYAGKFVEAGANIIGGCCGTTPEHLRAMAKVVTGQVPRRRRTSITVPTPQRPVAKQVEVRTILKEKLGHEFVMTAEIDAPPGLNYRPYIEQVKQLMALGIDAIQVTDNPMARVRMSSIAFAHLVQLETGMEVVLHFTCRDRNLLGIQSELMGAAALGVDWILALTGDPSSVGELPGATSVFDVNSAGLVRILNGLNHAVTLSGTNITIPTHFRIGASVNPAAPNLEIELTKLKEKIDNGADFAQTQPVYDLELLANFAEKTKDLKIPILVGLMPLRDSRHAEYLHNEVPGIKIPASIRARLSQAPSELVAEEAINITGELLQGIRGLFPGVHFLVNENIPVLARLLAK